MKRIAKSEKTEAAGCSSGMCSPTRRLRGAVLMRKRDMTFLDLQTENRS